MSSDSEKRAGERAFGGVPDSELVRRVLEGEESAYAELLQRHQRAVYTLVRRMVNHPEDAAEITQDAFVKAYQALARFDPQFTFRAWIMKISSNIAIDFLRRRRLPTLSIDQPREYQDSEMRWELPDGGHGPDEIAAGEQMEGRLAHALTQLTPAHRQILLLLYQEKMSYDEISALLDEPLGTVKARIHRARESLRLLLAPYLEEPS